MLCITRDSGVHLVLPFTFTSEANRDGRLRACVGTGERTIVGCGIMNQQSRRAARGIALAVTVLGVGCDAMQSRTPIDVSSLGPQVGERVPGFSLPDQNGRIQTLDSILGPNGALLLFHRSADW